MSCACGHEPENHTNETGECEVFFDLGPSSHDCPCIAYEEADFDD